MRGTPTSRTIYNKYINVLVKISGGVDGIRTHDTPFEVCSFSKRVPSASRPRLRAGRTEILTGGTLYASRHARIQATNCVGTASLSESAQPISPHEPAERERGRCILARCSQENLLQTAKRRQTGAPLILLDGIRLSEPRAIRGRGAGRMRFRTRSSRRRFPAGGGQLQRPRALRQC